MLNTKNKPDISIQYLSTENMKTDSKNQQY